MSAPVREPLPYPHRDAIGAYACQFPEGNEREWMHYSANCPGCVAASMARVITDPSSLITYNGERDRRLLDALREALSAQPEFSPHLVLFERALRERGIA